MIIRPDNRYTKRINKLVKLIPITIFLIFGGGLLVSTLILSLFVPGSGASWTGVLVVVAILAVLCFLLDMAMSKKGFQKLLNRVGTHLTPEGLIFENPYLGRVVIDWDDIEDMKYSGEKRNSGIFFRLFETSQSYEANKPNLLAGKSLVKAGNFHWCMTPDLFDRPPEEMYGLISRYWQNPAIRRELEETTALV